MSNATNPRAQGSKIKPKKWPHQNERNVLGPEHDINVQPEPVNRNLHPFCDGVHPPHPVEDDVDLQ